MYEDVVERLDARSGTDKRFADLAVVMSGEGIGVAYDSERSVEWRAAYLELAVAYLRFASQDRRNVVCDGSVCGDVAHAFVDACAVAGSWGRRGVDVGGDVGGSRGCAVERGVGGSVGGSGGDAVREGDSCGVSQGGTVPSVCDRFEHVRSVGESGGARDDSAVDDGVGGGEARAAPDDAVEGVSVGNVGRGKHYAKNRAKKEKLKKMKVEARLKREKMQGSWRGYCETVASEKPSPAPSSCPGLSSATTSQSLIDAEAAARESLARRRVVENELAMAKAKAQIASYADVEKSKAIAELKIARIAQWNNEARMKSQKSWADYKRSLESSPVPSFKASDLPSAASAGEYWWKQQCLKSKEMEEQIKHLEALLKASMPYVSPEGLEKMREVPDPEPVIDPEFEALKRAHRELAVAEGLDGYDSGDDIGYDLFMPPRNL